MAVRVVPPVVSSKQAEKMREVREVTRLKRYSLREERGGPQTFWLAGHNSEGNGPISNTVTFTA